MVGREDNRHSRRQVRLELKLAWELVVGLGLVLVPALVLAQAAAPRNLRMVAAVVTLTVVMSSQHWKRQVHLQALHMHVHQHD